MSVLERNKSLFPLQIRERGRQYYQRGRVTIEFEDDSCVISCVEGSRQYEVEAQLNGNALHVSCSCPYAENDFCKHIYAALLKVEAENRLPVMRRNPHLKLRLVPFYDIENDLDDDDGGFFAKTPPPAPVQPSWSLCLDEISTAFVRQGSSVIAPRREAREIVYLLRQSYGFHYSAQLGRLALNIACRARKKNGQWGQIKTITLTADALSQMDELDARIAAILTGAQSPFDYNRTSYGNAGFTISETLADVVMPLLASSGRLFFQNDEDETIAGPLEWHPDEVWTPSLALRPDAADEQYCCELELVSGTNVLPLTAPPMITREGLMLIDRKICRVDVRGVLPWIEKFRAQKKPRYFQNANP